MYGHRITAHTDHKNLTDDNSDYSSDRILWQRLVIEEYGTEIKCIPGIKNTAPDALSRISTRAQPDQEYFAFGDKITENDEGFTLNFNHIVGEYKTCPDLIERLQSNKCNLHQTHLWNDRVHMHIWWKGREGGKAKIYVPRILRDDLIAWFHNNLHHLDEDGTRNAIKQHLAWSDVSKWLTWW